MIVSFFAIFLVMYLIVSLLVPTRIHWVARCLLAGIITVATRQLLLHTSSFELLSTFFNSSKFSTSEMRLYYPIIFVFIYIFCALLFRGKRRNVALLLAIILLVIFRLCDFDSLFFTSVASTKIPLLLLILQGGGIFAFVLFILLTIVEVSCSLAGKAVYLFSKKKAVFSASSFSPQRKNLEKHDKKKSSRSGVFSLQRRTFLKLTMATLPTIYSVKEAIQLPKVKPMELAVEALPNGLDGLRIVQITDLHASILFGEDWVRGVVERVNTLKPDLILFTGDMTDGTPAQRRKDVKPLADLAARYGIFGCMGNHDYYSSYSGWMKMFPRLGITMLENTHKEIKIDGASLVIAGVPDIVAGNYNLPMPDPKAAFTNVPDDSFCIMLDHRPSNAVKNAKAGAHLQLSGHTHGGQVLGMDLIVKEKNNGFVRGWYIVNKMSMYVGSGAGLWSGFPVRLGVPSELPCITIRKA